MLVRRLTDPDLEPAERRILADIAEHGLHVPYIPPAGGAPGWHFSVGMYASLNQPEVIVFGLREAAGHSVVNALASHVRAGGTLVPDTLYPDLLQGVACTVKTVEAVWYEPIGLSIRLTPTLGHVVPRHGPGATCPRGVHPKVHAKD